LYAGHDGLLVVLRSVVDGSRRAGVFDDNRSLELVVHAHEFRRRRRMVRT
jgi:hypothetical protein